MTTHEYRYISPVFEHGPDGNVARLLRAALTNNPNLYLTAISARIPIGACVTAPIGETPSPLAIELCALLGIVETGSAEEIIDAVRSLTGNKSLNNGTAPNATSHATARAHEGEDHSEHFVPVVQFQQTLSALNTLQAARAYKRAEHAVTEALRAGKLIPAQREWGIAYCTADYQDFSNFISRQPTLALGESEWKPLSTGRLGNQAGTTADPTGSLISQAERDITTLGIAHEVFLAHKSQRGGMLTQPIADSDQTFTGLAKG